MIHRSYDSTGEMNQHLALKSEKEEKNDSTRNAKT
jgi:hypothetical protein